MSSINVTLLDAGMGKTLSMKGVDIPPTIWSANALIVAPEVVKEVHKENIAAGANIITTNSYGIIRGDLAKEGLEDKLNQYVLPYSDKKNKIKRIRKHSGQETEQEIINFAQTKKYSDSLKIHYENTKIVFYVLDEF